MENDGNVEEEKDEKGFILFLFFQLFIILI
jgi:hypothetical protein